MGCLAANNTVLLATNSIQMKKETHILAGDVVVNDKSLVQTLAGVELSIDKDVVTSAGFALRADSVKIDRNAEIGGDVHYNDLTNKGTIVGSLVTPLSLPVFASLPPFNKIPPRFDAPPVNVPAGATQTLGPGDHGHVTLGDGAVLKLSAGVYGFLSLTMGDGSALTYGGSVQVSVDGKVHAGIASVIGPATGSPATAASAIFYVGGINGLDGGLFSEPSAVNIRKESTIAGTIYAPFGRIAVKKESAIEGQLIARDISFDEGCAISLVSAFADRPPTADPKTVNTNGAGAINIILTGSDPEATDLIFSIVTGPTQGGLGSINPIVPPPVTDPETGETRQPPITSASVTYTPSSGDNVQDSFVYKVTDAAGNMGSATVTINPTETDAPPAPDPTTVVVIDVTDIAFKDTARGITLGGQAPAGVGLTFSIVGAGGSNGTLDPLVQGTGVPQRTATTTYTPNAGFLGGDSFVYEACGTINSVVECDQGTYSISVIERPVEPPDLVVDRTVGTFSGVSVEIPLGGGNTSLSTTSTHVLRPRATTTQGAGVAGNVADTDLFDQINGDNANNLPGPSPIFMSAGVNQSGGPGSNGTVRMHFEWDIGAFDGQQNTFDSATIQLNTHRGSVDSLDTEFYWPGNTLADGQLSASDFGFPFGGTPIDSSLMPVPSTTELPIGADGTFSFDVLAELNQAIASANGWLVIQGRVDETLTGNARGLEVRTTATGNLSSGLEPKLVVVSPDATPNTVYSVLSLPANGTLKTSFGSPIASVPFTLVNASVVYTPNTGFVGADSFGVKAERGALANTATVFVDVIFGTCEDHVIFCDDGR